MRPDSFVASYFEVKWDGIPAADALAEAKAAAINVLRRRIAEIEMMDFATFARRHCAPDVGPETIRPRAAIRQATEGEPTPNTTEGE